MSSVIRSGSFGGFCPYKALALIVPWELMLHFAGAGWPEPDLSAVGLLTNNVNHELGEAIGGFSVLVALKYKWTTGQLLGKGRISIVYVTFHGFGCLANAIPVLLDRSLIPYPPAPFD